MTLTKCPSKGRRVSFRAAVMVVLALAAFGATNVATAANQIPPGEGGGWQLRQPMAVLALRRPLSSEQPLELLGGV